MDIKNEFKVLNIKGVLKEAFILYKVNFKTLMTIAIMMLCVNLLYLCESSFNTIESLSFFMLFVHLFFQTVLSVVLMVYLSKKYMKVEITIMECYEEAKRVVWKNYRAQLRILLKMLLPLLLMTISRSTEVSYFKWALAILVLTLFIWIITNYSLVPVIRTLEPNKKKYFKYARAIIKRNFWKVLILSVLVNLPFFNIMVYREIFGGIENISVLHNFIASTVNYIFLLFIYPYFYGVYVVLYYELTEIQNS